jgi:hypothetical protein
LKYFVAETCGARVRNANFIGHVHSVFTSACNIQTKEGDIFTLLEQTKLDQPRGIRVITPKEFCFSDWIKFGDHVFCYHGCLQIKEPNFYVDMRHAILWQENLPIILTVSQALVSKQWQVAANLLSTFTAKAMNSQDQTNRENIGIIFWPKLYSLASSLTKSTREQDWLKIETTICSLIGLGPGLTPWGDDFLCGFLSGYECLVGNLEQKKNLYRLRNILLKNSKKTSDISQAMLSDVATGQHSKSVIATCQSLFEFNRSNSFASNVSQLLEIGDTSGAASCFGILSSIAGTDRFCDLYENYYLHMVSNLTDETLTC